jgi:hypothetical protein
MDQNVVVGLGLLSFDQEVTYALDDFRNSAGSVAVGTRQLVHAGRVYSHSSVDRSRGAGDPVDNGSQAGALSRPFLLKSAVAQASAASTKKYF